MSPTGGAANGMPLNARTPFSRLGSGETRPAVVRTGPSNPGPEVSPRLKKTPRAMADTKVDIRIVLIETSSRPIRRVIFKSYFSVSGGAERRLHPTVDGKQRYDVCKQDH